MTISELDFSKIFYVVVFIIVISFVIFLLCDFIKNSEKCFDAAKIDYNMDNPDCSYNGNTKFCSCTNLVCKKQSCESERFTMFKFK